MLGNIERPQVRHTTNSFELRSWSLVGSYAVLPRWADGHETGIYSFQYLRRLADVKI